MTTLRPTVRTASKPAAAALCAVMVLAMNAESAVAGQASLEFSGRVSVQPGSAVRLVRPQAFVHGNLAAFDLIASNAGGSNEAYSVSVTGVDGSPVAAIHPATVRVGPRSQRMARAFVELGDLANQTFLVCVRASTTGKRSCAKQKAVRLDRQ